METTKKQYQTPELKKYGKVSEVTQTGGTTGSAEDTATSTYQS